MEHYERGRYVTNQVALWICNDGAHYERARSFYLSEGSLNSLANYLIRTLKRAPEWSTPWYVAQELAPNDYARIDWREVAGQLAGDEEVRLPEQRDRRSS